MPSTGVRIIVAVVHCFSCKCARAAPEETMYSAEEIDADMHVDLDDDSDELREEDVAATAQRHLSALKK
jgi:hypothetical protein